MEGKRSNVVAGILALVVVAGIGAAYALSGSAGQAAAGGAAEGSSGPFLLFPTWPRYIWDCEYDNNTRTYANCAYSSTKDKPTWGLDPSIFAHLPPYQKTLPEMKVMYRTGRLPNEGLFDEKYWSWPNFQTEFEEKAVPAMKAYDPMYSSTWCVGAYPAYKKVTANLTIYPEGQSFHTYTWLKTPPTYEFIAGVVLRPYYPYAAVMPEDTEYAQAGANVTQDPAAVRKVIKVRVEVENATATRWIKRVKTILDIEPGIKPGLYAVGWQTDAPDEKFREEMAWTYGLAYQDAVEAACGTMHGILFVQVVR